jgi:hypothetical protein
MKTTKTKMKLLVLASFMGFLNYSIAQVGIGTNGPKTSTDHNTMKVFIKIEQIEAR